MNKMMMPSQYLELVSRAVFASGINAHKLDLLVDLLKRTRALHGTVWIAGNGGSAATASHFANDLAKMCGIRAISLSDMTPTMTAYGNDDGWSWMYANYLEDFLAPQDVFVAISCSGRSENILHAADMAIQKKNAVVVLTGMERNNILASMAHEICICIDHPEITIQEDVHLAVCHAVAIGIGRYD